MGLFYSNNSSHTNVNNNFKIDAVSGILVKNDINSFIFRCKIGSDAFSQLEGRYPFIKDRYRTKEGNLAEDNYGNFRYTNIDVVILQAMLAGDDNVIFELIEKKDWDKLFEGNDLNVEH